MLGFSLGSASCNGYRHYVEEDKERRRTQRALAILRRLSPAAKRQKLYDTSLPKTYTRKSDITTLVSSNRISHLSRLPPELLHIVADYLLPIDQLSLRCTERAMNMSMRPVIHPSGRKLQYCERSRISEMLAFDRKRRRCAQCKVWCRSDTINDGDALRSCTTIASPDRIQQDTYNAQSVPSKPSGCCQLHNETLVKFVAPIQHDLLLILPNWLARPATMCMHCGKLREFNRCCDQAADTSELKQCSCGTRSVTAYTRYGGSMCVRYQFRREKVTGRIWVREWYAMPALLSELAAQYLEKFERDVTDPDLVWRDLFVHF